MANPAGPAPMIPIFLRQVWEFLWLASTRLISDCCVSNVISSVIGKQSHDV